jgi:cytochrome c oxidase accessory protein FixG
MSYEDTLLKPEGRVLSTLEADGSRRWLYPRLAKGLFLNRRKMVGWGLILLFAVLPFIEINNKPAVLIDILNRRFTFFGVTFLPTDTVLLALLLLTVILSVFAITALFGRVWCGWGCPQTVYLEFVYRPVERFFLGKSGIGGKPAKNIPAWKYVLLYAAYLLISLYVANVFLAYFVGVNELSQWITQSPFAHPTPFIIVALVTAAMMFDFSFFREQTCIIACPYGRFQSVLLDKQSTIIGYDIARGEPRMSPGKARSLALKLAPAPTKTGDCIDCGYCSAVCPTGIDIRDGLQIECIGCAQCIDACDAIMEKAGRPKGLVRYASAASLAGEERKVIRPRVVIYFTAVGLLLSLLGMLIMTRPAADVTFMRNNLGAPFITLPDGRVQNTMRLRLVNRTDDRHHYKLTVVSPAGIELLPNDDFISLDSTEAKTLPVHVRAPPELFHAGHLDATVSVADSAGHVITRTFRILGPLGSASAGPSLK